MNMEENESALEVNISSSEDEGEVVSKPGKDRPFYNNKEGLIQRLKEIFYDGDWVQRLDVSCDTADLDLPKSGDNHSKGIKNVHDDFNREMSFYCQSQVAAKEALSKLRELDIPSQRPEDYFAEMVKTDSHMQKIREKLLNEKKAKENAEKAKKIRKMKAFGKKVQQEVLQKRQEEKRKMLQAVDRLKKDILQSFSKQCTGKISITKAGKGKMKGKSIDDDVNFDVNTEKKSSNDKNQKSLKRERKDQKYGFGGKQKRRKMNSSNSASDMSGFKSAVHSKAPRAKRQAGKNKNKRLGKSRRNKVKGKKR